MSQDFSPTTAEISLQNARPSLYKRPNLLVEGSLARKKGERKKRIPRGILGKKERKGDFKKFSLHVSFYDLQRERGKRGTQRTIYISFFRWEGGCFSLCGEE